MEYEDIDKMTDILQAYKEGKEIQVNYYKDKDKWENTDNIEDLSLKTVKYFRIKPKEEPFSSNISCALEMTYHSFPGEVRDNKTAYHIVEFNNTEDKSWDLSISNTKYTFKEAFDKFVFMDGSKFGTITENYE